MTLKALYHNGTEQLQAARVPDSALDAWYLLEAAAGVSRSDLYVHPDREIEPEQEQQYLRWIEKRASRIPLQRILGEQEFMGLSFLVGEQVLIPRQDTEILVEQAMARVEEGYKILDMCTGTGCIALSLAALCKQNISVIATDISQEALEIAEQNRVRLEIPEYRAQVRYSDLFGQIPETFHMIISNPPYIPPAVIAELEPEVRQYDPMLALDGGEDGLDFYRRITAEAPDHLVQGGYLLYEIGYDQGEDVSRIMEQAGLKEIQVIPDLAGLDRVVIGRKMC